MQRADTPHRQVLWPEVAKVVRVKMIAAPPCDRGGDYVAVLFIVRHPRNQRLSNH